MLPHQIKQLNDSDLINHLVNSTEDSSHTRKELKQRAAQLGFGADVAGFLIRRTQQRTSTRHGAIRIIDECVMGRESLRQAATALLNTGWDYRDPAGLMSKTPAEVADVLQKLSVEGFGSYRDLPDTTYSRLIKMIFEAYGRSCAR